MASGVVVRKNQYYDSLFLMGVNKRLSDAKGVQQTAVLMGSPANKQLLAEIGVHDAQVEAAGANDLIVAVVAETPQLVAETLSKLDDALQAGVESAPVTDLHSLEDGLAQKPNANLVVISVPGEYAAREAQKALDAGLNVFLFSDNVAIEDELRLKQAAAKRHLLVMGPDCGTSLIGGVGIGFANAVRRGPIGAVGAAGTGLQEFTSLVHNAGFGISHAIGTGSHDLSDKISGLTTLAALEALEKDPSTKVITLLSKPVGPKTLAALIPRLGRCPKPVVGCFLGARPDAGVAQSSVQFAHTVDEAARLAIRAAHGSLESWADGLTPEEKALADQERSSWAPQQKYLRGLFAGGTFCYQSQQILRESGIATHSNAPLNPEYVLANPDNSVEHTLVDMGDDHYTLGRPHPMIDASARCQRILNESRDPQVAILLFDVILGHNASKDPAGELIDAIRQARQTAKDRGNPLSLVASVCGTEGDVQDLSRQIHLLQEAGVRVFNSNARATLFCCELLKSRQGRNVDD